MKDDSIRKALEGITPLPGAEERMYRHIQQKAKKNRRPVPVLLPAAACLACVLALLLFLPGPKPPRQGGVMTGNPVVQMQSLSDLTPAGLVPQLPEEAEVTACALISGEIARVEFIWQAHSYTVLSSALRQGDFTYTDGDREEVFSLSDGITVYHLDDTVWKAALQMEQGQMYLLNSDGADRQAVQTLAQSLYHP